MKERPIIFSAPMVRAILEGRKTQTRRIVKDNPVDIVTLIGADDKPTGEYGLCFHPSVIERRVSCPYGQPGDRLWVRERGWMAPSKTAFTPYVGNERSSPPLNPDNLPYKACPSIHMPRWASRIDLEITGIRVERLCNITPEDCWAEGLEAWLENDDNLPKYEDGSPGKYMNEKTAFRALWQSINGPGSWIENPWVWAVKFKRISP